jgi:hypothetical protein
MVAFSGDKGGVEEIGRAERLPNLTLSFVPTPLHPTL